VAIGSGLSVLFIIAVALIHPLIWPALDSVPIPEDYDRDYGDHPFRPSQTETASNEFIHTEQIAESEKCGSCHRDIFNQWLPSTHKQAASDPTYVTNVSLLAKKKGISATRYCEGCHAPIALLTGELTQGGEHGGIIGTQANIEGVSCMSCHGISSLTHLKGVASYVYTPRQPYLFEHSDNKLLRAIHDLLIRVKPDQHKSDLGNPLFKEPKFCASCHTQFMDKDLNNWGWIKMQDEYQAWLSSPYSAQHEKQFSNTNITRCQDCHMPLTYSDDPSANKDKMIRAHRFPGANTFLPILSGDSEQLKITRHFLQSNKIRVSIDKPNRADAIQNRQALDESIRGHKEAPYYYYLGEEAKINIVLSNQGVGHDFPGGTLDINEAWVEFLVLDAEGATVFTSGEIGSDNKVDRDAYFYRAQPIDKKGNLVWKHDLFNMVGESFKRVIKAGESDIVAYSFPIPSWTKSPITVTTTLKYRKINDRYARWALKEKYFKIPPVDMARDSLSIPIRIRKEVEVNSR